MGAVRREHLVDVLAAAGVRDLVALTAEGGAAHAGSSGKAESATRRRGLHQYTPWGICTQVPSSPIAQSGLLFRNRKAVMATSTMATKIWVRKTSQKLSP